ncbi:RNase H domain-containing protein [Aphis craccivora]|uniref:RNase H domain-containing protein n=1 Tax=Aphis craccivora TaxID=307492 RepID=A0A6G0YPR1_APHCR|nr:RNase H domain-containing protein [Aphis craccivora]
MLSKLHILFSLTESGSDIQFIWVPGHTGIAGNEFADKLSKFSASLRCPSRTKIPWSDFIPILRSSTSNLWLRHWSSFPPHFTTLDRNISPTIPTTQWFHNLDISRKCITSFSHLRFRHTRLLSHSFKLSLNDSPLCTLHNNPMVCVINHLLFIYPSLSTHRDHLLSILNTSNIPFDTKIYFLKNKKTSY